MMIRTAVVAATAAPTLGDVTLTIQDISAAVENVLDDNRVVQDVLNQNDVNVEDVVDVVVVDNVVLVVVDVL